LNTDFLLGAKNGCNGIPGSPVLVNAKHSRPVFTSRLEQKP